MSGSTKHLASPPVVNPRTDEAVDAWMRKRAASDPALRTAWAVRPVVPPAPDDDDVDDVIDVIGREHGQLRQLQQQLQTIPGATAGASPNDLRRRGEALAALRARLAAHEKAESRVLWPAVRERIEDGEKLAARGQDQEKAVDQLLARLNTEGDSGVDEASADYDQLITELVGALRKHFALEDLVLSRLYNTLSEQERTELGRRFKADRQSTGRAKKKTTS